MTGPRARAINVREYVANAPPTVRAELERLRRTILSAAPTATEVISYGLPAVRGRRVLVYYGAFQGHLSLFPGSAATRRRFAKELRPWSGGKGTVRFTPEHPLPAGLIRRIVRSRVAEDRALPTSGPPRSRVASPRTRRTRARARRTTA